jgi:seryl-tRNA synthetase
MLDLDLILRDRQRVEEGLRKRLDENEMQELLDEITDLAGRRRQLVATIEDQRHKRKVDAQAFATARRENREPDPPSAVSREELAKMEAELREVEQTLRLRLLELPNLPADDVLAGGKEANRVVKVWGEKPENTPLDHLTIERNLGLVDYDRGVKLGGSGFWIYTGMGARLEWALIDWFIEQHTKAGFTFMLPPHLLLDSAGYAAGQFPKFWDDVYHVATEPGERGHFLLPTAETAILGAHQDEIFAREDLPLKVFAYTPCYREERAGSHSDERGTVRGHQFNKVEIFQFTTPDQADAALEEMVAQAESLVEALGLHYQRSLLAAGDASASMRKTLDIEVWMPSSATYKEVSSVSWAGDYQARRAGIRYREPGSKTSLFLHTLNGSALATSRVFPALLEQFQDGDGVIVPEVLRSRVGTDRLGPA